MPELRRGGHFSEVTHHTSLCVTHTLTHPYFDPEMFCRPQGGRTFRILQFITVYIYMRYVYRTREEYLQKPPTKSLSQGGCTVIVELAPNRVMGEMVLDGGGHFLSLQVYLVYTHYLYYYRPWKHMTVPRVGKEHQSTNVRNVHN